MLRKNNFIQIDTGFLRFYEQHQNSIEFTTAISPELERYFAALKGLANRWLDVGMTFVKKSETTSEKNPNNSLSLLNVDGSTFNETDELSEFDCLRNQLAVLIGCFAELPARSLFEVKDQSKECFPSSINDTSSNLRLVQKLLILNNEESVLDLLTSASIVLKKTAGLLESIEISSTMIHDDLSGGVRFLPKMLSVAADLIVEAAKLTRLAGETAQSNEENWSKYEQQITRVNSEVDYEKSRSRCDAVFPMWELITGLKMKEESPSNAKFACSVCDKIMELDEVNVFEEQKDPVGTEGLTNREPIMRIILLCKECLKKKQDRRTR